VTSDAAPRNPIRIPPLADDEWTEEARAALASLPQEMLPPPGTPINVLSMMAHHPALMAAVLPFSVYLRWHSTIDDRQREILILRTAWLHAAEYELLRHAKNARRYGFTEDELVGITVGAEASCWSPAEALLVRMADELDDAHYVSDATWSALLEHYSRQQLMDMLFTVGYYTMLGMAYGTIGLQPEPDLAPFPVPLPAPHRPGG